MDKRLLKIASQVAQEEMRKQAFFGMFKKKKHEKKFLKEMGDNLIPNPNPQSKKTHPKVKIRSLDKAPKKSPQKKKYDDLYAKWEENYLKDQNKKEMKKINDTLKMMGPMYDNAIKELKREAKEGNTKAQHYMDLYDYKGTLRDTKKKIKGYAEKAKKGKMSKAKAMRKIQHDWELAARMVDDIANMLKDRSARKNLKKQYKSLFK